MLLYEGKKIFQHQKQVNKKRQHVEKFSKLYGEKSFGNALFPKNLITWKNVSKT